MRSRKEMWDKKREWDLDERSWEVPMSFFLIFHFVTLIAHFVSLFFFLYPWYRQRLLQLSMVWWKFFDLYFASMG